MYVRLFGEDFEPEPYIKRDYEKRAEAQMVQTARHDLRQRHLLVRSRSESVSWRNSSDIIGRNFKQPQEGLGWDGTPASHMWRTIMMPTRAL